MKKRKSSVLVSVVIPVYNAEKYLARALDSIVNQSFDDYEIIIVNDGSKDSSENIIKKYLNDNDNISLINKENQGAWYARIDGIKNSNGKYIAFMDADDVVDKNYLRELYNSILNNDSDISICAYNRIDEDTNKVLATEMTVFKNTVLTIPKDLNQLALVNTSNWNKMYKKELFNDVLSYEVKSISLEDLTLNVFAYINTSKISFVDIPLYNYYVNRNSLMKSITNSHLEELKNTFLFLRKNVNNSNKNLLPLLDFMAVIHLGFSINQRLYESSKNNRRTIKELCKFIKNNFPLWKKYKTSNLKLLIIKIVFRLNMVYLFIKVYVFSMNKLKINVKW